MRLAIILILLAATNCSALDIDQVTFNHYAPGSLRVKYTGIKRIIIDEARDFFEDEWKSDANILLNSGQISYSQYRASMVSLRWTRKQYGLRGRWWERSFTESMPPDKGGAPHLIKFIVGRTGDIIDLGIARVNENFKFKLKDYKKNITRHWTFRFKPHITGNTSNIISIATASFVFEYSFRKRKSVRITIQAGYKKRLNEFIEFRIEMLRL